MNGDIFDADRHAAVRDRLASILAGIKGLQRDAVRLDGDSDFLVALDMDSIDAVELTVQLDQVFKLRFGEDPDDIDHLASFGRLVELVLTRADLDEPAAVDGSQ